MELKFIDANVILRYLTQDQHDQSEAAAVLFQQLDQGTVQVATSESVIVEVVQVLASRITYNLPRDEIRMHVNSVLGIQGLRLVGKQIHRRALDLYASTNVDYVDALSVAQMEGQGIKVILSFDRDFDRFPSVEREEPTRS